MLTHPFFEESARATFPEAHPTPRIRRCRSAGENNIQGNLTRERNPLLKNIIIFRGLFLREKDRKPKLDKDCGICVAKITKFTENV
ncbi:MAG: hypothetical protein ACLR8Y_14005 [Alistipes indistinctus]